MVREETWTPQPLPLYDTSGKIVPPHLYEAALAGSLTSVKFSLTRRRDSHAESYHYRANVEEIHLIQTTQVSMGCSSHAKLVESIRNVPAVRTES